jgi:hypothetical protein
VVDGRKECKRVMGIPYPRRELENLDIIKINIENKSSISRSVMCGLQGSGTIYRLEVGHSQHGNDNAGGCRDRAQYTD